MLVAVGLIALLGGGQLLVSAASSIARRLGVSSLLIGLTVVAFGTSAPELALNVTAAASSPAGAELAFGNVVGSNLANIGLVLGIACLIGPVVIRGQILRQDLPLLVITELALICIAIVTPGVNRIGGLILLCGMLAMATLWFRNALTRRDEPLPEKAAAVGEVERRRPLFMAILLLLIGLGLLIAGAKSTEIGAISLARLAGVGEVIIGLTIVAIATSLPEVATAVIAVSRNEADLAVGTVVGSNLFNILLVLAITALVRPIPLPTDHAAWTMAPMLGLTCALYLGVVRPWQGKGKRLKSEGRLGPVWGCGVLLTWILVMCWTVFWM